MTETNPGSSRGLTGQHWQAVAVVVAALITGASLIYSNTVKEDRERLVEELSQQTTRIANLERQIAEAKLHHPDTGVSAPSGRPVEEVVEPPTIVAGLTALSAECSAPGVLPMTVERLGYRIELRSCSLEGDEHRASVIRQGAELLFGGIVSRIELAPTPTVNLLCSLMATSTVEDRKLSLFGKSKLVESDGTDIFADRIQLGTDEDRGGIRSASANLERGVPVKMSVLFAGLNLAVSSKVVPVIDLDLSGSVDPQFRCVPVS